MKTAVLVAAAASLATAQTFPGFPLAVNATLGVVYGNVTLRNGQQLPRGQVLSAPSIAAPVGSTGRAVLICMDSDVPVANSSSRTTLLHWLQPDIVGAQAGVNASLLSIPANATGAVQYQPPNPPQGDYPHRYTFVLFEQPRLFVVPSNVTADNRRNFNLAAFIAQSGLNASTPIGANYMLVANTSGPATTSFPPALFTASSTLPAMPTATNATASASARASSAAGGVVRSGSAVGVMAAVFGALLV